MKLAARLIAETPPFFTKARNIGLVLTAISTALIGLPAVPVIIAKIATYLAVAGTVLSGISQAAVYEETSPEESE
ncbi:hypothetical protein QFZ48_003782 [Chitinophaga sp. W2I13]|uniref:hypothetical protein n=1 Tax=Chitinophaga sp. W2I13 TaxID=3373923 RepID=UPI003D22E6FA